MWDYLPSKSRYFAGSASILSLLAVEDPRSKSRSSHLILHPELPSSPSIMSSNPKKGFSPSPKTDRSLVKTNSRDRQPPRTFSKSVRDDAKIVNHPRKFLETQRGGPSIRKRWSHATAPNGEET
ncbi:hypothetical protein AVEN_162828-1 [Araneus ventricosus]|uniref:Uncharacterized protein n=1 Tax=Araneus ventricosus TaxID=182803 RepID=A0A4Y2C641_ARAVE|nr:hypothetical protein AVEN_162828-1 [Araneus ventricosus]